MDIKRPSISIVIPTYNSVDTIRATLDGCLGQDYPKDRLEVIIVDDGSTDGTREVVKNYPVRYIYQKRQGPAAARNTGWKNASGEGVCFTDSDCVPLKNWVSRLSSHFFDESIGAIAGSYDVNSCDYLLDRYVHYEIKHRHGMMRNYSSSFGTYNVLIKRRVLENLNGFDSSYSMASGEDTDMSYRIIKSGYKIYFDKDALVGHNNVLKFSKYMAIQFKHGFWRMKLYRKNIHMIKKDEYGYWKDFLETGFVLALIPSFLIYPAVPGLILTALLVLQIPPALEISLKEGDFRYMIFSLVTFTRSFMRISGGIFGFVYFWLFKR